MQTPLRLRLTRGRGLGCLREGPDARDMGLAMLRLAGAAPSSSTLAHLATVFDQGPTNSCVAQAVAQGLYVALRAQGVPAPVMRSRRFLYWNARGYHGAETVDMGTYLRTCLKGLVRFGAPPEGACPWDTRKVNQSPAWGAYRSAYDGRGAKGYYRIVGSGDDRLSDMRSAIAAGYPVAFGTGVDRAFIDFSGKSTVDPPAFWVGRHAMLAVGYERGRFRVVNSWGRSWGDDGFCWLSDEYLAHRETEDLWVVDVVGGHNA